MSLQFFPVVMNTPLLILGGTIAAGALASGIRRSRGTTLTMPCVWALLALLAIVVVELVIQSSSLEPWAVAPLRFLAAVGTFCPLIGLLGAKRPQDAAWIFIVLSLWGILIMPSFEVLLLQPGQALEVHDARQWFLVGLILVGLVVGVPTAMAPASLSVALGQSLLLMPHLPGSEEGAGWEEAGGTAVGPLAVAAFALAALWWRYRLTCRVPSPGDSDAEKQEGQGGEDEVPLEAGWSVVWRDYRDWYGLLWALRVAERVNAVAEAQAWPVRLRWQGFVVVGEASESRAGLPLTLRPVLMNLLRRFVNETWVEQRLRIPDAARNSVEAVAGDRST